MVFGGTDPFKNDINNIEYGIYGYFYSLVYPVGINIVPIGYSLCPIGAAGPGAGPARSAGAAGPPVRGAGGGAARRGPLREGPADRAGPAPGSAAPIGHRP